MSSASSVIENGRHVTAGTIDDLGVKHSSHDKQDLSFQ